MTDTDYDDGELVSVTKIIMLLILITVMGVCGCFREVLKCLDMYKLYMHTHMKSHTIHILL